MLKKILLLTLLLLNIGYTKDNIVVYNAYGNNHQVIVQGRMQEKQNFEEVTKNDSLLKNFYRRVKHIKTNEIKNKTIYLQIKDETFKIKGDDEGYFEFNIKTKQSLPMGYQKIFLNIEGNKNIHENNATIIDNTPLVGIISDFDDTIIISNVTNKISFGVNTIFKNYKQRTLIPTMLERFKKILAQNPKDTPSSLFILSGSPQQLFRPIEQFLEYYHFPKHTLILKKVHGENLDPLIDQFAYKTQKIEQLIKLYPNMKWVMFGDSGEKDSQVYKAIKEKYPKKVLEYYIRDVKNGEIYLVLDS